MKLSDIPTIYQIMGRYSPVRIDSSESGVQFEIHPFDGFRVELRVDDNEMLLSCHNDRNSDLWQCLSNVEAWTPDTIDTPSLNSLVNLLDAWYQRKAKEVPLVIDPSRKL